MGAYSLLRRGFTLVETVITVAVLALLVGLSTPPVIEFFIKYKNRQEQITLTIIQKNLDDFAQLYNRVPDDNAANNSFCGSVDTNYDTNTQNDWYECLAAHSQLSVRAIALDTWGRARVYVARALTENVLNVTTTIYYATVHSVGSDRLASNILKKGGTTINGLAVSSGAFLPTTHANWWARNASVATVAEQFEELQAGGDDHLLKYTDLLNKVEKYSQTSQRIQDIGRALQAYADRYSYLASITLPTYNEFVYYPPSYEANTVAAPYYTASSDSFARHDASVRSDLATYGTTVVENRDSNAAQKQDRRSDMIALMRAIGLPDEYCCNALVKDPDASPTADQTQERPFFYYSNPRPMTYVSGASYCNARPLTGSFFPAVVTIAARACN
ncbi:MAG: type II secretion system protein [Alphaproteobacteria bacterium]